MNCQYCNNPIPPGATTCPSCGAPVAAAPAQQAQPYQQQGQPYQQGQQPVSAKSPFTAGILSCLIPGLGQIYNGQIIKGIVIIIANIAVGTATAGIAWFAIGVAAIIDANNIAKKINSGRQVGEWEFF